MLHHIKTQPAPPLLLLLPLPPPAALHCIKFYPSLPHMTSVPDLPPWLRSRQVAQKHPLGSLSPSAPWSEVWLSIQAEFLQAIPEEENSFVLSPSILGGIRTISEEEKSFVFKPFVTEIHFYHEFR
ncbi:hypothetical protein E2C01_096240 [Portunus trituberculatus]|uniref:Uncharacterized protein n=1 Tax=Portunus trituberculatus TaxID=210409 RepID=A0A5B7K7Q5_PORTR|nr:hypothetical protein [Portunus trituberculatus]